jgi:hypothetical protein
MVRFALYGFVKRSAGWYECAANGIFLKFAAKRYSRRPCGAGSSGGIIRRVHHPLHGVEDQAHYHPEKSDQNEADDDEQDGTEHGRREKGRCFWWKSALLI